jgi:hypothetical protein
LVGPPVLERWSQSRYCWISQCRNIRTHTYQDLAETVATQLQLVRGQAGTDVSKIKRLLPVQRRLVKLDRPRPAAMAYPRVAVRNRHVGDTQSVEDWPPIVADVAQDDALAVVESNMQAPFLPSDDSTLELKLTVQ